LLTLVLVPFRGDEVNLVSDMLIFLLMTVVVALVGGLAPALIAAVGGSVLLNFFFTPPYHTLTIGETNNALALFVFVLVATLVSSAVDLAARRTREAARAAAESHVLATLAGSVVGGNEALEEMLERTRETLSLASVTLFERVDESWSRVASAGPPCASPGDADTRVPAGDDRVLALRGGLLEAEDQRLLGAFAAQVGLVHDRIRLAEEAAEAAPLAAADRMRTALLAAVGHDLRTPLAAAKASISSLLSRDVHLDDADRDELLVTADESLDRLTGLVENLLDMSRLQAGALSLHMAAVRLDEVLARALDDLGPDGRPVLVDVPDDLPGVHADAGLLERVLANLVLNALRFSPADHPPLVTASKLGDRIEVRVVDRGPGIPEADRESVFLPFQRLGDTDNTTGVGLGLALSRGLAEAMNGTLEPEETPGGGLTMVVGLEAASDASAEGAQ
jgi:two-component system sensor histidine kinase KdpD